VIGPPQDLYIHRVTQKENAYTHVSSGIRTSEPSVRSVKDGKYFHFAPLVSTNFSACLNMAETKLSTWAETAPSNRISGVDVMFRTFSLRH